MSTKPYKRENLANVVLENTREYAKEVALRRSIPYVSDGLKPVARALAYVLYQESGKLKSDRYVKSQDACATVIGKYHPHNLDSVYETVVKMSGDKGSIFESGSTMSLKVMDSYTAPRYTAIRLSKLGRELFTTLHLCEMEPSEIGYDMPKQLLARFPYQLFTYNVNIGVGTSNQQLPLNPKEVINALTEMVRKKIEGKEITTDELMNHIKGPDLHEKSTIFMSKESLSHLIEMGVGHAIEVCDIEVIESSRNTFIHIKELPYRETSPNLTTSILHKSISYHDNNQDVGDMGKISGISDEVGAVIDQSSEEDIRIVIKLDKKFTVEHLLNELYTKTSLKRSHSIKYIMVDETGNEISLYSIRDLLNMSIDVNKMYFKNVYETKLAELERQFEINTVLEKVTRPEHTEFVGKAVFKKEKVKLLLEREGLDLTAYEITEILFKNSSMLKRLSDRDIILKELEDYKDKKKEILERLTEESIMKDILDYCENTLKPIVEDLDRSSEVVYTELSKATPKPRIIEIPDEKIVYTTENGLICSLDDNGEGHEELLDKANNIYYAKDNDFITIVTEISHFKIPVKDIPSSEVPISSFGVSLHQNSGQRILGAFLQTAEPDQNMIWYFINNYGCIKTVKESVLYSKTKSTKSTQIEDDENIVEISRCAEENSKETLILLVTRKGFVKLVLSSIFQPKNRESRYNKAMNLEEGDEVIYVQFVSNTFDKLKAELELNNETNVSVEINREFIKPILNKGIRVIERGLEIVRCKTDVFEDLQKEEYAREYTENRYVNIFK